MIFCFLTRDIWFVAKKNFLIKSRTSVRDLLFSHARHLVLLAKKKSRRNVLTFFWARFTKFPRLFFFFFFFFLFFFRTSRRQNLCVSASAKTVKDRKISKIYFYSYDTEAGPVRQFSEVARAICSQEHLPSNFCTGHCAKTVWDKK